MASDKDLKSKYEASLLEKYNGMFPAAFIECIKNGVTWLANHNGITYQTSALIATDSTVYESNKGSILKIGLIDVSRPLAGVSYYSVRSMTEEKDSVNGNTIFKVKLDYTAPIGIEIMMIPITYFSPYSQDGSELYYTKEEVASILNTLKESITLEYTSLINPIMEELTQHIEQSNQENGVGEEIPEIDWSGFPDLGLDNGNTDENIEIPDLPDIGDGNTGGSGNNSNSGTTNKPSRPQLPALPTNATPIQKLVYQLHSLAIHVQEVARENVANETSITAIKASIAELQQTQAEIPTLSEDDIVHLPEYYTKDEVDIRLATKVSTVAFDEYKVQADAKYVAKPTEGEQEGTTPPVTDGDGQGGDPLPPVTEPDGNGESTDNGTDSGDSEQVVPTPPVEQQPTPVTELTLGSETASVDVNAQLEVTVTTNASDFSVESKDPAKATVEKGEGKIVISGVEAGEVNVEIKATVEGGSEVVKTVAVTVNAVEVPPVTPASAPTKPTLNVNPTSVTLDVNGTQVLTIETSEGADFIVDNSDSTKISFDKDTKTLTALAATTDPVRIGFRPTKDGVNGDMSNVMVTVNQPAQEQQGS